MGSQMGSQMMTSGVGASTLQSAQIQSETQLDSIGSQFKGYGSETHTGSVHSQVSGSLMSSMNGSILSQLSENSVTHESGITLKKTDVPRAIDVMKKQQLEEVAALTEEQLERAETVVFRETPM